MNYFLPIQAEDKYKQNQNLENISAHKFMKRVTINMDLPIFRYSREDKLPNTVGIGPDISKLSSLMHHKNKRVVKWLFQ